MPSRVGDARRTALWWRDTIQGAGVVRETFDSDYSPLRRHASLEQRGDVLGRHIGQRRAAGLLRDSS